MNQGKNRSEIKPGLKVHVVLKKDQRCMGFRGTDTKVYDGFNG